jgi:hypothetical protein
LGGQISSLPGQYWISSPDPIKERLEMVLIAQGARILKMVSKRNLLC